MNDKQKILIKNYSTEEGTLFEISEPMKLPLKYLYVYENQQGQKLMFTDNGYPISSPAKLRVGLQEYGFLIDFSDKKGISKGEYIEYLKNKARIYDRFSCMSEINPDNKTQYSHQKIEPKHTGKLREFLDTCTFETLKDQYRYCAGLLTPFLGRIIDGLSPLFSSMAITTSSGKTTVCRIGMQIVQGLPAIELIADRTTDSNAIGSKECLSKRFCFYDNLENLTPKEMKTITKYLTDLYVCAHFMFWSHSRARNNKVYFCSFNNTLGLTKDLLERMLIIRMQDGRDVNADQKRDIDLAFQKFVSNRREVMRDIYYYLSRVDWKVPIQKNKYIPHPKYTLWSQKITKILEVVYPEVEVFDYSLSEEDKQMDDDLYMFNLLLDDIMRKVTGKIFISNKEIRELYKDHFGLSDSKANLVFVTRRVNAMAKSVDKYLLEPDKVQKDGYRNHGWWIERK